MMRSQVVDEDGEGANERQRMVMRTALGQLHDEFNRDVDALAAQIRRELHGRSAD